MKSHKCNHVIFFIFHFNIFCNKSAMQCLFFKCKDRWPLYTEYVTREGEAIEISCLYMYMLNKVVSECAIISHGRQFNLSKAVQCTFQTFLLQFWKILNWIFFLMLIQLYMDAAFHPYYCSQTKSIYQLMSDNLWKTGCLYKYMYLLICQLTSVYKC